MRSRIGAVVAAAVCVGSMAAAPGAQAGVVERFANVLSGPGGGTNVGYTYTYRALPVEQNDVTVHFNEGTNTLVFEDPGNLILPGVDLEGVPTDTLLPGLVPCTIGLGRTECPLGDEHLLDIQVYLEDGDDSATNRSGRGPHLEGGEGNDRLINADPGATPFLSGGPGNDVIRGGAAKDFVSGGAGADDIGGGGGRDELNYDDTLHDAGVTVTLDELPNDGLSGEADNIRSDVEFILLTDGPDVFVGDTGETTLIGRGGADDISGGGGNDRLFGDDGDDTIVGGPGADLLSGRRGNDGVDARDGERDEVLCGTDVDVALVDPLDVFGQTVAGVFQPAPDECETQQTGP